jgi:hypothetical protein
MSKQIILDIWQKPLAMKISIANIPVFLFGNNHISNREIKCVLRMWGWGDEATLLP